MNSLPPAGSSTRILVVDDEKPLRDILEQVLSLGGYEVRTAADGDEALDLVRQHRFDLVITDMIMPGKEGIETIMALRGLVPEVKIIAISGGQRGGAGDFLPLAMTLGASATLKKPFDRQTLIDTVRAVLVPAERQRVG